MSEPEKPEPQDENTIIALRRAKLAQLRERGAPFPNDFRRNVVAGELHAEYGEKDNAALEATPVRACVAGRMMSLRVMGKASFAHLQDMSGRIQLYVQRETAFRDEFLRAHLTILEVAVGAAVLHRGQRPHPANHLEAPPFHE